MTHMRWVLAVLLAASTLSAEDGMMPGWEVREMSELLVANAQAVEKILGNVRPKEWIQDGAPEAYVGQHAALASDLENVVLSAQALGREPEKLSYAVDTFLWLDRFNSMTSSMSAGVRRYQSEPVADLLDSANGKNTGAIAQLKEYMRQLAVAAEQEMEIANSEAQRCRAEMVTQPR